MTLTHLLLSLKKIHCCILVLVQFTNQPNGVNMSHTDCRPASSGTMWGNQILKLNYVYVLYEEMTE